MTGREFYDAVAREEQLTWEGVRELPGAEPEVLVRSDACGQRGMIHAIPISQVIENADQVLDVLMGRRDAQIMIHLTRIVGYYSRVQNWNRSKLAELNDRHAGAYSLPETTTERKQHDTCDIRARHSRAVPIDADVGVVGVGV